MKFPFTIRFEYSSRKKNGGLRDNEGWLSDGEEFSKAMAWWSAGDCGTGEGDGASEGFD